jgi:hypothetical protein
MDCLGGRWLVTHPSGGVHSTGARAFEELGDDGATAGSGDDDECGGEAVTDWRKVKARSAKLSGEIAAIFVEDSRVGTKASAMGRGERSAQILSGEDANDGVGDRARTKSRLIHPSCALRDVC